MQNQIIDSRVRAMWLMQQMTPDLGVPNLESVIECAAPVDSTLLGLAATHVVRRQPALRSAFPVVDGVPVRVIRPAEEVEVGVEVMVASPADLDDQLSEFVWRPFDLAIDLLLRVGLWLLPDGRCVIAFVSHHIVFDANSAEMILEEVALTYESLNADGRPPALPPVPEPAGATEPDAEGVAYWRAQLADVDAETMQLRNGRPTPAQPTFAGDRVGRDCPPEVARALERLRTVTRASENMVMLAAYFVTLFHHGGGRDLVVGVPVNVRSRDRMRALDYQVNTLPLRLRPDAGMTFGAVVAAVRDSLAAGLRHASVPAETIRPDRPATVDGAWRTPLFRHMFNYMPTLTRRLWFAGAAARMLPRSAVARSLSRVDIELYVEHSPSGLGLHALYSSEIHDRAQIEAFLQRYEQVLLAAADDAGRPIGAIEAWSPADHAALSGDNRREWPGPETVPAMVAERVRTDPDRLALVEGDRRVTYGELAAAAARTRDALVAAGVRPGDPVGVCAVRSARTAAAMLGVWAAGGHYLPLDPAHPAARLLDQLADVDAAVLVDDGELPGECLAGRKVVPVGEVTGTSAGDLAPVDDLPPGLPAYVMFTSGSTGRPKGVRISHAGLHNNVAAFGELLGAGPSDRVLWLATVAFDISSLELFLALATGAHAVVVPPHGQTDAAVLAALLAEHRPTVIEATPTGWQVMAAALTPGSLAGVRALCGGEPMPAALATRLLDAGARLFNVYGPTETTVWCTAAEIVDAGDITVGRPLPNMTVHILGDDDRLLPPGLVGEVCIGGIGLAAGYVNRPDLTAERFVEHPVAGPLYRSGDLGSRRPDGRLHLVGRNDRQVKLRGNRLELGEVEAVLRGHPAVTAAAALVSGDDLVAFVTTGGDLERGELWDHAARHLPRAAVPSGLEILDALPQTPTGKVDYRALATRDAVPRPAAAAPVASGSLVDQLVALWRGLLDVPADAATNFFHHGGHSLHAARLAAQAQQLTGTKVSLREIYDAPTPAELAELLTGRAAEQSHA
ncbi:non-ribosomal peptide synthetase [Micromonospora sp. DT43]|uniref:non-ribosomal peptide synthetase n=1 Tax=Micromonospora sp. DT43 TaxID=3393440 RepID=UPI003CEF25E1